MVALYLGLSYLGMMSLHAAVPTLGAGLFCLLLAPEFYAPLRRLAAHYHDRANALAAAAEVERLLQSLPDEQGLIENEVAPLAVEPASAIVPPLRVTAIRTSEAERLRLSVRHSMSRAMPTGMRAMEAKYRAWTPAIGKTP